MKTFHHWINWITNNKFRRGNFTKENLRHDLYAGLIVGLISIPQSLALAQLAGLPPVYGLYASILPVVVAVLFGSSNYLSTGPVAVLSILTATTITPLASPGSADYITYAVVLALASGLFQIGLGILRAGWLVNFLSHPVVYGFTNAAALIIIFTQLGAIFGISVPTEPHLYATVWNTLAAIPEQANWAAVLLGTAALIFIFLFREMSQKIPGSLIVLAVGTFLCWWLGLDLKTIGVIESPIPRLTIPEFHLHYLYDLLSGVVIIAIIGFTEAVAVGQSIATKAKQKVNPDDELIGQGLANVASAISGGYPVAGSISRSALNYSNGAKTWMASVFCSAIVLITVIFFFDVLKYTPQVLLSIIIIVGVASIINLSKIKAIFSVSYYDGIAALLTFFGTLIFAPNMEMGLIAGVVFSIGYFIYRNTHPYIVFLSRYKDGALRDNQVYNLKQCKSIAVVRLDGPLFFANALFFENKLITFLSSHQQIKHVILAAGAISQIDATGAEMLDGLVESLQESGKTVYVANIKYRAEKIFKRVGLWSAIHEEHFYTNTQIAVKEVIKIANQTKTHADGTQCPLEKEISSRHHPKMLMNSKVLTRIAGAGKYILKPLNRL